MFAVNLTPRVTASGSAAEVRTGSAASENSEHGHSPSGRSAPCVVNDQPAPDSNPTPASSAAVSATEYVVSAASEVAGWNCAVRLAESYVVVPEIGCPPLAVTVIETLPIAAGRVNVAVIAVPVDTLDTPAEGVRFVTRRGEVSDLVNSTSTK